MPHNIPGPGNKPSVAPAFASFVADDGEFLTLHFSERFTQSRMSLRAPNALTLLYTRKMMAFLLFKPAPEHVALVGLGGGSMTKFCHRRLPRTRVTTVEIDENVIAMAHLFRVPNPDERLTIVHADAAEYFAGSCEAVDVVLVDGCDDRGIAPAFRRKSFYASVRKLMRPGGIIMVNLIGTVARKNTVERMVARTFDETLSLHVPFGGNRIAMGFCDPVWPPDWPAIHRRSIALEKKFGLGFEDFAQQLERNYYRRSPRRSRGE